MTIPRKVAVIGAGDIGVGWAALCASAGWPVAIFDLNPETMERASIEVERRTRALVALDRAPQIAVSNNSCQTSGVIDNVNCAQAAGGNSFHYVNPT